MGSSPTWSGSADTVRRTPPANLDFVAALLRHLAEVDADLAPRHLGTDALGRQVLSHLDGRVPWRDREDPAFFADPALVRLAELIRRLHDACAGSPLAGDAETVCHRDLSPKNTVYRDSPAGPLPVAFLDWDLAAPGRRIEDVAFAAWHWAPLGPDADPVELGRRCRVLCDAYGPLPRRRAGRGGAGPARRHLARHRGRRGARRGGDAAAAGRRRTADDPRLARLAGRAPAGGGVRTGLTAPFGTAGWRPDVRPASIMELWWGMNPSRRGEPGTTTP